MKHILFTVCITLLSGFALGQTDTITMLYKQLYRDSLRIESLTKKISILEDKVSRESLDIAINTAEGIISKQNNYITIFEVIFGAIAVISVFVSFIAYFYQIRPLTNRAERAVERAEIANTNINTRFDNFNNYVESTLNSKFDVFESKIKEERLNQVFLDLLGNLQHQRKIAIEFISTLPTSAITSQRISQLFDFLSQPQAKEEDKLTIVEILTQIEKKEIKTFFTSWDNVKPDNNTLKMFLLKYYTSEGIIQFLKPISNFIIYYSPQHEEFKTFCGLLSSLDPAGIKALINYPSLIEALHPESKLKICEYLNGNKDIWNLEVEVDNCLLCRTI